MKKYMLMLVFMASILWGCGNSLKEGEIYEKTFTPEHYENVIVHQIYRVGASTVMMMEPRIIHHSDSWEIKIRDYNEAKQRYDTATYYVDKDTFDRYNIGDLFQCEN